MAVQQPESITQGLDRVGARIVPIHMPRGLGDVFFVSRTRQLTFRQPVAVEQADTLEEVSACLHRVEEAVAEGLCAAGFMAYEAAPALDSSLSTGEKGAMPLAWFGLYQDVKEGMSAPTNNEDFRVGPWETLVSADDYTVALDRIRALIAAGDTYQVNYTFPMRARFEGDSLSWFRRLCEAQGADHCAFVDTGRYHILSASPELFFELDNETLVTRPMKGTRPRGLWSAQDNGAALELVTSDKERAENVMIVDLLRNDMGRISDTGSVRVSRLFEVERYPTVWQMTSTITSRTAASVPEIFTALFPSGSVTGAPKIRTMEIIRELEPYPRGIYCGCVGWWLPGRRAQFNVAIRTVAIDTETQVAEYHVGGGITWDSITEREHEECCTKAKLLSHRRPDFELLESILFDGGYFLLHEHLDRLTASAAYFGFSVDRDAVETALLDHAADKFRGAMNPFKVRLLLCQDGTFRIESAAAAAGTSVRLGLAAEPVDKTEVFLFHKTTHREVYERARVTRPDCDDVLLWNLKGEITESTVANIVLDLDGTMLTPALSCGLLPGTMRQRLLAKGLIQEAVLTKQDVLRARAVWLVNSVRKWIAVDFVDLNPP